MSTTPSTFAAIRSRFVDEKGMLTWTALQKLLEYEKKLQNAITLLGEIASGTKIQGRTEGIGTTVVKLTAAGLLEDADQIAADGSSFVRVDADQRTGGGRGFVALDANSRLAGAFRNNVISTIATFTGANPLSQDGTSTNILVAASTQQYGDGQVSYNSGSVDPGSLGLKFIYVDDPTFAGGAVTYQSTTSLDVLNAANGRVSFGQITTAGGGGGAGSGGGGGCPLAGAPVRLYGVASEWRRRTVKCEEFICIETKTGRVGTFSRNDRRYCDRGLLPLKKWKVGDLALTEEGEERVVSVSCVHIRNGKVDSYEAPKGHIYSAWGFIGHNLKPV